MGPTSMRLNTILSLKILQEFCLVLALYYWWLVDVLYKLIQKCEIEANMGNDAKRGQMTTKNMFAIVPDEL